MHCANTDSELLTLFELLHGNLDACILHCTTFHRLQNMVVSNIIAAKCT